MRGYSSDGDPVLRTAVIVIALTLGFATLRTGADVFAPMVLALVFGVILAPITEALERLGLSAGVSAMLVMIFGFAVVASLAVIIEPFIWRIRDSLPQIKWELRGIVTEFRGLIRGLDAVNKEVEAALGSDGGDGGAADSPAVPNIAGSALLFAPRVVAHLLIFFGALFFFLLTRKNIYDWVSRYIGTAADTAVIMERFTRAEKLVSKYFLTIAVINVGVGAALTGALMLIGLPGALLWGLVAALLNFILYLGPIMVTSGLLVAGLVAFQGVMTLAPAVIFLFLNMIEAQFVTPMTVGRHIAVNPLLIFVSLVVWLWIWGPIGGIVAIPVLVIVLVMLDIFQQDAEV